MIRKHNSERGMALIVVLFALMLLTSIGLGLMYMTTTETGIDSNFRSSQQAYYASKAGLEEARERLRKYAPNAFPTPPTFPPSTTNPSGVIYVINPSGAGDSVTPWVANSTYFDDELCHENYAGLGLPATAVGSPCPQTAPTGNWYTVANPQSTDPYTNSTASIPYKWVRVTRKQIGSTAPYCLNSNAPQTPCPNAGTQVCAKMNAVAPYVPQYYETPLPAGTTTCQQSNMREVYVLTSLSRLPDGSRKMTQYEVSPISLPPLPSTITLDGSGPNFSPPHSNALKISGVDNCGQVGTMPAMGGYDANSTNTLIGDIPGNTANNYQGTGGTPSVVNVSSTLGMLSTVGGLETLVQNIDTSADQTFGTNPTISSLGTTSSPMITVVNGDYTWNPQNTNGGAGLLLVTGTLTIQGSGNSTFNGVVLVVGKGQLVSSGNGTATINGGLFVANLYDSSGALLPSSSGPGVPSFTWNGAGNLTLNYDSCWMTNLSGRIALRVLASHEEVY